MKFWLILLVLGWRLRFLAWRNEDFRKAIEGKELVMQWRTQAGNPSRWYRFSAGSVNVSGGLHAEPGVSLSFADASYAAETIMQAGKNQMIFMQGMQEGKITIEGNPGELMWFMGLMKYIMPKKKKKKA